MYFNIAFDIATLLIVVGIALANLVMFTMKVNSSKAFKVCVSLLAISTVFDILAAITGADIIWDSDNLNVFFETIYMCAGLYCLYAAFIAIASRINYDYRKQSQVIFVLVSVYTFLLLINFPTRLLFTIVDGAFHNKLLFYVAYSIPVFVMLNTVVVLVRNKANIDKTIFKAMMIAVMGPVVGVVIQLINDRLILIQFGLGITVLILNFIWETPDAKQLEEAIEELEEIREKEEASRLEVEMADRVKARFLSNLSDELVKPVEDIKEYASRFLEYDDPDVVKDASSILEASEHFKELVSTISQEIDV